MASETESINLSSPSPSLVESQLSNSSSKSIKAKTSVRKRESKPCHDEADKIINFLLEQSKGNSGKKKSPTSNPETGNALLAKYRDLEKEILSVCRRIKRANKSSKGLLDVLNNRDESICLIIKRNQDGRIQVNGRKVWPHAFMYHLYVTFIRGDTAQLHCGSHSELRTKTSLETPCQFPFGNERSEEQTHLCINPFHYEDKLKIDVNHYVKKPQNTSPKVLQWKNQEDNEPEKFSATLTSEPRRENKTESEDEKLSGNSGLHIDNSLTVLEQLSISDRLWIKPMDKPPSRQFSLENAKGIIKYNETVSKAYEKRSSHNTRSRSPRESRRQMNLMEEQFKSVAQIKSQLEEVSLQETNPEDILEAGFSDNVNLSLTEQFTNETNQNATDEADEYLTITQPIILMEETEKPWCTVSFYECNTKVDFFSSTKTNLDIMFCSEEKGGINRYTKDQKKLNRRAADSFETIDLSTISNVNRSSETWDLLEKMNKGICLIYDRDRRIVSCQNNCKSLKVYVLSYLMNVDCGKHEQSLIQVGPGTTRVVYDGWQLAKTIDGINSQTQNDLEKWVLVGQYANYFTVFRISYQPWGPDYAKKRLTECDAWLEIQMREYLDWINQIESHYEYVLHDSRFDKPPENQEFQQYHD